MGISFSKPADINKKSEKTKLFWLDKVNDDVSTDFREEFKKAHKNEFQNYYFAPINGIQSDLDEMEKIIIVCRRSTCRLEHMLDFFFDGVDECSFDKILVIIVHNKDLGETPHVPSKIQVVELNPYKKLHFIIDVVYTRKYKTFRDLFPFFYFRTETIFDQETLPKFLGDCDQSKIVSP